MLEDGPESHEKAKKSFFSWHLVGSFTVLQSFLPFYGSHAENLVFYKAFKPFVSYFHSISCFQRQFDANLALHKVPNANFVCIFVLKLIFLLFLGENLAEN